MPADVLLVSHTHWDREWYRPFEGFRARLVDTVDRVLQMLDDDPGWAFLLDGQAIVLEDYLVVRPAERDRLAAAVASGRLAVGPWYVQPDSLLPSGESHVRNLLEGRRVAMTFGRCSEVAYAPDSFGHPAQFPQLFVGFGLGPFVHWRGNGNEVDRLGPVYRWEAPDGSTVLDYVLASGYFSGAGLPEDPSAAGEALEEVVGRFPPVEGAPVVVMVGVDHMYPQAGTGAMAEALAERTGARVRRGVLDDLRDDLGAGDRDRFRGDLLGGRLSNLLPGVWSSRLPLKLADRRAERALVGWAEPFAALGRALGLVDEAPSLREARRALVANQAHDSIGGCSIDDVHRQMAGRTTTAIGLAEETTARVLERLAGLDAAREVPWTTEQEVAVVNPSPVPRTDIVRIPLDGFPLYRTTYRSADVHPLSLAAGMVAGMEADGRPVRVIRSEDPNRVRMIEDWPALDVELVVDDVPAFGWRTVRLTPSEAHEDVVDDGRTIEDGSGLVVTVADDGTLTVTDGTRSFSGLAAVEDDGDRGDTYDFDPVVGDPGARTNAVEVERHRHPSGVRWLSVTRTLELPARVVPTRDARSADTVATTVRMEVRLVPGTGRVDLDLTVDDPAEDHRLRLLFPTGSATDRFRAGTTFDVADRSTAPPDTTGWWHAAAPTFPHQGWVAANGLVVGAPGLPEAEVTPEGTIAITVLRAVGWLSHIELGRRPIPAGPAIPAPGAQCPEGITARLTLRLDAPDREADGSGWGRVAAVQAADELGLRGVPAGPAPIVPPGTPLLEVAPGSLVLSTVKPAEDGDGFVIRLLNPTDTAVAAAVTLGVPVGTVTSVRLDETDDGGTVSREGSTIRFDVGAHALRSVRVS